MTLQQLASLGHGHFQRCGVSLKSIKGAFTAISSTISQQRTSTRKSSAHDVIGAPIMCPASSLGSTGPPVDSAGSARPSAPVPAQQNFWGTWSNGGAGAASKTAMVDTIQEESDDSEGEGNTSFAAIKLEGGRQGGGEDAGLD